MGWACRKEERQQLRQRSQNIVQMAATEAAAPETILDTDAAALKKAEANRKKREKQKAKKAAVKEAIDISDAMMLFGELPGNPVHAASPAVASARRPLSVQASLTVFRSGRVRAKIRVFVP